MKTYWTATAVTAFVLLSGGLADLLGADRVVAGIVALGYPAYLAAILGVWKILGAVAITVPGHPRLKEWAYAGIVFDLSGAAVSHLVSGSPLFHPVVTTTLLVVALISWTTRPASRRLVATGAAGERVAVPV
ncbi:DoxX family protein [Actinomycetospora rhizophila]|uniref:DoxX family protein n=1 Tax=Actinomycetospora rhizophila TaxID=1416876 RepID=A0ABV9ZAL7_9PSEU